VPGTKAAESHLGPDELELGMGIHNEPGTSKLLLGSVAELVANMLSRITDTTDPDRGFVPFKHDGKDEVVLLVNCLGAVSELEMSGITGEGKSRIKCRDCPLTITAVAWLRGKNIAVRRVLAGTYMTSLNMPGFSLTLLLLPREGEAYSSEDILSLLDAPASAPGWRWTSAQEPGKLGAKVAEVVAPKGKEVDLAREWISARLTCLRD
jgi:dihydroxyacetone kinase